MTRRAKPWLTCVAVVSLTVGCSDDNFQNNLEAGGGDKGVDQKVAPDSNGLPDGYGPLYTCKEPGKACNAHDPCAINPICGKDLKCYPSSLMDCNDNLDCTTDTCAGLGLCINAPKTGFCALPVKTGGSDGGTPDSGGLADAGSGPDATPFATVIKCFKKDERNPNDTCMICKPSDSDSGSGNSKAWSLANGGSCDDSNLCTKDDYCQAGVCKGTYFGNLCADGYGCTTDLCDGKGGCLGNKLKPDYCLISKVCYKKNAPHPQGSCFTCDPSKSTTQWTPISNTCMINSKCYNSGAKNPAGCGECDPAVSTTKWTVKGTTCCWISSKAYTAGTKDSTGCSACDPTKNKYDWTALPGMCKIAGKCFAKGAKHSGGCAECDPAVSSSKWTVKGTTHCLISDKCYAKGAPDSTGCGTCDPTKDLYDWTPKAGLCKIAGKCYTKGTAHPKGCAVCDPSKNATLWTLTSKTDCLIDHECYKPGTIVGCSKCDPSKSQTSWTKISGCVSDLAKLATASSSGGGSSTYGYGPELMNDGKGESGCKFHWISAGSSLGGGKWIMYTWTKTIKASSIKVDTNKASVKVCSTLGPGRNLAGGTLQYWSGSAWVKIGDITGKLDDWTYNFTQVSTTKLRLYDIHTTATVGQKSNPALFEWQVYGM